MLSKPAYWIGSFGGLLFSYDFFISYAHANGSLVLHCGFDGCNPVSVILGRDNYD